jgi:protocatechuate 3,4-dioxygenase beta subunit
MKTRLALALFALSIACPAVGTASRPAVGRVVDTSGRPIAGATVHLLPANVAGTAGTAGTDGTDGNADATAAREALVSVRTDARGRFAVKKLPAGPLDLAVRARRFAPVLLRGVVPSLVPGSPAEAPADLGKIVLQAGAVLTGSVEDPEGRPLAGALVRVGRTDELEDWLSWAGAKPENESRTGVDGGFEAIDLTPGEWLRLRIEREGYASRTIGLDTWLEEPPRIVLTPISQVAGRVLDEAGSPIPAARVILENELADSCLAEGPTDALGRFAIAGITPGRYTLHVSAADHLPAEPQPVQVVAGSNVTDLKILLSEGAVIEGQVTTADGDPAVGAEVRLADPSSPLAPGAARRFSFIASTRTDGDGRYRLGGVATGHHRVAADLAGHQKTAGELDVEDAANWLDLRLGETGNSRLLAVR